MGEHAPDKSEAVIPFAPAPKAGPGGNLVAEDSGRAIIALLQKAADMAKEDCARAMDVAHKLSFEIRAVKNEREKPKLRPRTFATAHPAPKPRPCTFAIARPAPKLRPRTFAIARPAPRIGYCASIMKSSKRSSKRKNGSRGRYRLRGTLTRNRKPRTLLTQ